MLSLDGSTNSAEMDSRSSNVLYHYSAKSDNFPFASNGQRIFKRMSGWRAAYPFTPHLRWMQVSAFYPLTIFLASRRQPCVVILLRRSKTPRDRAIKF